MDFLLCLSGILGVEVPPHTLQAIEAQLEHSIDNQEDRYTTMAQMAVESRLDVMATSSVGAKGLMQLTSIAVEEVERVNPDCVPSQFNPYDLSHNIKVSLCYKKHLTSRYKSDILELGAYNGGGIPVKQLKRLESMNNETSNYIVKIMYLKQQCEKSNEES